MSGKKPKISHRDVSSILQYFRELLLGRKATLHNRFPPKIAPRTISPADIPRGPVYKYADQWYFKRTAYDSVKPPVVAPIAEGPPLNYDRTKKVEAGGVKPDTICFPCLPTPGRPYAWDGHCYYESDLDRLGRG